MTKSLKILVSGDVSGKLDILFKKVCSVNKKNGPFDMLICNGEFFDSSNEVEWLPYKEGKATVPLPTYILGPANAANRTFFPDLRGCELAENIIYFGPSGIYPCSSGLKIAYLSGCESLDECVSSETIGSTFNLQSIKAIELSAGNKPMIDILITSEWPNGVFDFANLPDGVDVKSFGSKLVSRLAFKLKPRYHFVGLKDIQYERLPYRNHQVLKESTHHVTRMVSLANVGNHSKRKWIYAINCVPICHLPISELLKQPDDVTECPYPQNIISETEKTFSTKKDNSFRSNQFFYDTNAPLEEQRGKKRPHSDHDGSDKRTPRKPTGPCWFCLASPDVEKHLVVSVGAYSYLALAKGGLTPDHLLILPIEHFQSTADIEEECKNEIHQFKNSLKKMFEKTGDVVVFFERNYKTQHMQVQVVPLPKNFLPYIKEAFLDISESRCLALDEVPKHSDLSQMAPSGTPFFYTELPDGKKFYHRIRTGFPIQFGREVLASPSLLNIPDKVDWKTCKISQSKEISRRDEIRRRFKSFDFTLDSESSTSSDESSDEN